MDERLGSPTRYQDEELEEALDLVGDAMSAEEWERHRRAGRQGRVEDLLARFPGRARVRHPGVQRGWSARTRRL